MTRIENYAELTEYLGSRYEEVSGYDFYREIFPDNEISGELNTDYSKPNAIYLYTDEKDKGSKRRMRRRIMLSDTWEQDYMDYVERNEGTLCGGLTYRGRANNLNNAQNCNALIIDLDGVGLYEIKNLFLRFGADSNRIRTLPIPTYLVASGTGLHVYYVFDKPLELFPYIKVQLKSLKHDLTFRMWDYKSTSQEKNIQYQSINQGFRMVGSVNSKHGTEVRAYRTGGKVSVEYLNQYADEKENRVEVERRFRPAKMSKAEAFLKYPEWRNKYFDENGNRKKDVTVGKWDIAGKVHGNDPFALYHWWFNKVKRAKGGHRYFFLMCMAIYACKVEVPRKKLKKDMLAAFEELKKVEHSNPMTMDDVNSALEMYSKEYFRFKIEDISKLTDIPIQHNKRNKRKQNLHLKIARATLDIMNEEKGKALQGRPQGSSLAKEIVLRWREFNPESRKIDCERETGLSRPTVLKWWDYNE